MKGGPILKLIARPWVDPVCLWGLKRIFPASRAWAAAGISAGDPERFMAELELDRAPLGIGKRLKKTVDDAVVADKKETAGLEKETGAATTGEKDIAVAESYASYGDYDKAIASYQAGIKKGGLKNPAAAQLHLAQTLLAAGKKAEADAAFKAVKGDAAYEKLAAYWLIAS